MKTGPVCVGYGNVDELIQSIANRDEYKDLEEMYPALFEDMDIQERFELNPPLWVDFKKPITTNRKLKKEYGGIAVANERPKTKLAKKKKKKNLEKVAASPVAEVVVPEDPVEVDMKDSGHRFTVKPPPKVKVNEGYIHRPWLPTDTEDQSLTHGEESSGNDDFIREEKELMSRASNQGYSLEQIIGTKQRRPFNSHLLAKNVDAIPSDESFTPEEESSEQSFNRMESLVTDFDDFLFDESLLEEVNERPRNDERRRLKAEKERRMAENALRKEQGQGVLELASFPLNPNLKLHTNFKEDIFFEKDEWFPRDKSRLLLSEQGCEPFEEDTLLSEYKQLDSFLMSPDIIYTTVNKSRNRYGQLDSTNYFMDKSININAFSFQLSSVAGNRFNTLDQSMACTALKEEDTIHSTRNLLDALAEDLGNRAAEKKAAKGELGDHKVVPHQGRIKPAGYTAAERDPLFQRKAKFRMNLSSFDATIRSEESSYEKSRRLEDSLEASRDAVHQQEGYNRELLGKYGIEGEIGDDPERNVYFEGNVLAPIALHEMVKEIRKNKGSSFLKPSGVRRYSHLEKKPSLNDGQGFDDGSEWDIDQKRKDPHIRIKTIKAKDQLANNPIPMDSQMMSVISRYSDPPNTYIGNNTLVPGSRLGNRSINNQDYLSLMPAKPAKPAKPAPDRHGATDEILFDDSKVTVGHSIGDYSAKRLKNISETLMSEGVSELVPLYRNDRREDISNFDGLDLTDGTKDIVLEESSVAVTEMVDSFQVAHHLDLLKEYKIESDPKAVKGAIAKVREESTIEVTEMDDASEIADHKQLLAKYQIKGNQKAANRSVSRVREEPTVEVTEMEDNSEIADHRYLLARYNIDREDTRHLAKPLREESSLAVSDMKDPEQVKDHKAVLAKFAIGECPVPAERKPVESVKIQEESSMAVTEMAESFHVAMHRSVLRKYKIGGEKNQTDVNALLMRRRELADKKMRKLSQDIKEKVNQSVSNRAIPNKPMKRKDSLKGFGRPVSSDGKKTITIVLSNKAVVQGQHGPRKDQSSVATLEDITCSVSRSLGPDQYRQIRHPSMSDLKRLPSAAEFKDDLLDNPSKQSGDSFNYDVAKKQAAASKLPTEGMTSVRPKANESKSPAKPKPALKADARFDQRRPEGQKPKGQNLWELEDEFKNRANMIKTDNERAKVMQRRESFHTAESDYYEFMPMAENHQSIMMNSIDAGTIIGDRKGLDNQSITQVNILVDLISPEKARGMKMQPDMEKPVPRRENNGAIPARKKELFNDINKRRVPDDDFFPTPVAHTKKAEQRVRHSPEPERRGGKGDKKGPLELPTIYAKVNQIREEAEDDEDDGKVPDKENIITDIRTLMLQRAGLK